MVSDERRVHVTLSVDNNGSKDELPVKLINVHGAVRDERYPATLRLSSKLKLDWV